MDVVVVVMEGDGAVMVVGRGGWVASGKERGVSVAVWWWEVYMVNRAVAPLVEPTQQAFAGQRRGLDQR